MLAYSSIAQIGYIILGIGFATVTGLTGSIIHLFNHSLMKGALFMALGCVFYAIGSVHIRDLEGMGRRMPLTMAAFVIAGLSLIGVPPTVGFVSKWVLVQAALEAGLWPIAALILASSLLAAVYIWRVVEIAYFRPVPDGAGEASVPLSMLVPLWVLTGASVYFGIDSTRTLEVARSAAIFLLEGGP
jgi:multicomponent Na+:H+ antiporter subunit D